MYASANSGAYLFVCFVCYYHCCTLAGSRCYHSKLASLPGSGTRVLICSFVYLIIYLFVLAPSWCGRHQIRHNRTPPHEPIVFIVFLVLFSFCSLLFYINCVFYTKKEPLFFVFVIVVNSP